MSVFERSHPPSPYWQIKFKLKGAHKARRMSSDVLMGSGTRSPKTGKWTGERAATYAQALEVEVKEKARLTMLAEGGFEQITLQQAMQNHFDESVAISLPVITAKKRREDPNATKVVRNFYSDMRRLHAAFGENTILDKINQVMIRDWRNSMLRGGRKVATRGKAGGVKATLRGEGLMPSTINAYLRVLSTVLNRAHEARKLVTMPKIEYLDEAELECKCLEDDEVDRLLAAARAMHSRFERLLRFLFNTGGRKTETFALTWKDVDLFSNDVCRVNFKKTKFGRQRFVPIPDGLRDMLRRMQAEQQAGGYTGNRVFAYPHPKSGNWLVPRDLDNKMKALRAAAEVEDFTLHVCRHTYASRILRRGGRLEEVSKLLGHKDITTTHRIYAHLDQNNIDVAVVKYLDRDWSGALAA